MLGWETGFGLGGGATLDARVGDRVWVGGGATLDARVGGQGLGWGWGYIRC